MSTVIGVFQNRDDAEHAIDLLRRNGIEGDKIGLVMRDTRKAEAYAESSPHTQEAAAAGATFGGVLGGIAGFLLGIGAFAIPGLGPIIAGGALAATLGGAAIGVASGRLIGALIGMGVPENEARYYEERVRGGDILVTVTVPDDRAANVRTLLDQAGATYFPSPSQAGVSGSVTTETSGIMGANMDSNKDFRQVVSNQAAQAQGGTAEEPVEVERDVLPQDRFPSGEHESKFIHQDKNDYPIDANDIDVSLQPRPLFGRGVEDIPAETTGNAPSDRTGPVIPFDKSGTPTTTEQNKPAVMTGTPQPEPHSDASTMPEGTVISQHTQSQQELRPDLREESRRLAMERDVPNSGRDLRDLGEQMREMEGEPDTGSQGYVAQDLREVGREQGKRTVEEVRGIERGILENAPIETRVKDSGDRAVVEPVEKDTRDNA